eukprot:2825511-Prymnesium_polylepis.2
MPASPSSHSGTCDAHGLYTRSDGKCILPEAIKRGCRCGWESVNRDVPACNYSGPLPRRGTWLVPLTSGPKPYRSWVAAMTQTLLESGTRYPITWLIHDASLPRGASPNALAVANGLDLVKLRAAGVRLRGFSGDATYRQKLYATYFDAFGWWREYDVIVKVDGDMRVRGLSDELFAAAANAYAPDLRAPLNGGLLIFRPSVSEREAGFNSCPNAYVPSPCCCTVAAPEPATACVCAPARWQAALRNTTRALLGRPPSQAREADARQLDGWHALKGRHEAWCAAQLASRTL